MCLFLNSAIILFFFFFSFNLDGMAPVPVVGPPVKYTSLTLLWGILKPSEVAFVCSSVTPATLWHISHHVFLSTST